MKQSQIVSVVWRPLLLAAVTTGLLACGSGGEIDAKDVNAGDALRAQPATYRDGGEPVTGTVVEHSADGKELRRADYVDGLPSGKLEEWYENGQKKTERSVKVEKREVGSVLISVGSDRRWCENGTLQNEKEFDATGKPVGRHQEWTCGGKPLLLAEYPEGEFKRWQELAGGDTVLTEEGTRAESGHLVGAHRSFFPDGKPMLVEHWKDEQLDGDYERYNANGTLTESGRYAAGKKVGDWRLRVGRDEFLVDHDPDDFISDEHAGPFMQAAGIDPDEQYGRLVEYQIDAAKITDFVQQGLVDVKKKLNVSRTPSNEFQTRNWTYPYVRASRAATPILRELGADPKAVDSSQRSRLHYCINSLFNTCGPDDVKELLAHGLDPKQADSAGNTPLHLLLQFHQVPESPGARRWRQATLADLGPLMQMLLDAGADVDAQNHDGYTPLVLALHGRIWDVAGVLVDKTQNPTYTTKEGHNIVHLAFVVPNSNQIELDLTDERRAFVERAVAKGVDPRQKLAGGSSLPEIAQQNGANDVAEYLIELK